MKRCMAIPFRNAAVLVLVAGLLSACGVSGPPPDDVLPRPVDMHSDLVRPHDDSVLAAPSGWRPAPTLTTPVFPVPAPRLFAAMQDILRRAPRTWLTVAYPQQNQAFYIVRSISLNLPDIVIVQAVPSGDAASQAVIFSQSRYDVLPSLIGENRARVQRLVRDLTRRFGSVTAPPSAR